MEKEKTKQFLMRPKNDFCFKQLMADAQIRQVFLSAVTGIPYEEIEETTLLTTSLEKRHKEDKKAGFRNVLKFYRRWEKQRAVFYFD